MYMSKQEYELVGIQLSRYEEAQVDNGKKNINFIILQF